MSCVELCWNVWLVSKCVIWFCCIGIVEMTLSDCCDTVQNNFCEMSILCGKIELDKYCGKIVSDKYCGKIVSDKYCGKIVSDKGELRRDVICHTSTELRSPRYSSSPLLPPLLCFLFQWTFYSSSSFIFQVIAFDQNHRKYIYMKQGSIYSQRAAFIFGPSLLT